MDRCLSTYLLFYLFHVKPKCTEVDRQLHICMSSCLFMYLCMFRFATHLLIYLFICLAMYLFAFLPNIQGKVERWIDTSRCLSTYLLIYVSTYLFFYLSTSLPFLLYSTEEQIHRQLQKYKSRWVDRDVAKQLSR